jgi:hypothetical protein
MIGIAGCVFRSLTSGIWFLAALAWFLTLGGFLCLLMGSGESQIDGGVKVV